MAEGRYTKTRIWNDDWFAGIGRERQHLFLYFLTNPNTNVLGIYEIPLLQIGYQTDHDQKQLRDLLIQFEEENKVFYERGWLIMKNWTKHQVGNVKVAAGLGKQFNSLPFWLREAILTRDNRLYIDFDRLLLANDSLSVAYTKPLSNFNLNFNHKGKVKDNFTNAKGAGSRAAGGGAPRAEGEDEDPEAYWKRQGVQG
jgi:hypothetical protein